MDYPTAPKQSTLTQYSMSASSEDIRCAKEESAKECNRANAIRTVRAAIKNNRDVFAWNWLTRNSDISEDQQRRNKPIITVDENGSDEAFMPKPSRRRYAKPTFTRPPHPTQEYEILECPSSDEEVVVALVMPMHNKTDISIQRDKNHKTHTKAMKLACIKSVSYTHLTLPTKRIV